MPAVDRLAELIAAPAPKCADIDVPFDPPQGIPGYEILDELGRGGMGVVYKARQTNLKRVVALKMILTGSSTDSSALARFRVEAEAAARLQHPHIVQIHEVGAYHGKPYLVREYVEGVGLDRALAGAPLPARAAAELVLTLAQAIQVAHDQGVVHRDLKPANILLQRDEGGRMKDERELSRSKFIFHPSAFILPKITDFGLAKLLDDPTGQTQTGAILGTPSYMAPEQAGGQTHQVGPAADIYALGAILYEAITGRPPFKAATVLSTLEQVRSLEPVPPGRLQPHLPRDLQTICLKCLEKEPRRRYPTAGELAEDLRRFLNGEPIRARPVGTLERSVKWARRNPAKAALAAISALAVVVLAAGVIRLRAEVNRAEAGERQASAERQRADDNYRAAQGALNQIIGRLNDQRLRDIPRLAELRRGMLEDALTFYEGILKQLDTHDPAVQTDVALAYRRTGEIQAELSKLALADQNLQRARELLRKLVADSPETETYRAELAQCNRHLALVCLANPLRESLGLLHRAEDYLKEALALCNELARSSPEMVERQIALGTIHHELADLYQVMGRGDAELHFQEARGIFERLRRDHPKEWRFGSLLGRTYVALASLLGFRGSLDAAEPYFRKAEEMLTPLITDAPESHSDLVLAAMYNNWGVALRQARQAQASLERFALAMELVEPRLQLEPDWAFARAILRNAHASRAQALGDLKQHAGALKDWDRALALSGEAEQPELRCFRAIALIQVGQYARAETEAQNLAAGKDVSPDILFDAACVCSLSSRSAAADTHLALIESGLRAENYARQALSLLGKLEDTGYFRDKVHAKNLVQDADLQPLHSREDFQRLMRRVK